MTIDLSNVTRQSTLQGVAYFTNNMTGGLLFSGGMIVFFIIILMVLLRNEQPFPNALTVSAWIMFTVSIFFWFAQLIPTIISLLFLMISAFGTFYLVASK